MTDVLTIDAKKIEIQWHNREQADRPCLVFLHEGLGCTAMWKDFPDRLSHRTGCPAFVFSRFGYGRSDPDPLPWKINFMHTWALKILPRIITSARIKEYILVGHSDGGSIGIIFAGTPPATGLKGLVTEAAHVFCEPISVQSIAAAKINYEQNTLRQGLEKYHGKNTDNAFYGWNDVWLNPVFMQWNIEKYLKHISVPVLALQGKQDQYGTAEQLAAIESGVPDVTTHLMDDCRHTPHFEQLDMTLDLMTGFIKTLLKQG